MAGIYSATHIYHVLITFVQFPGSATHHKFINKHSPAIHKARYCESWALGDMSPRQFGFARPVREGGRLESRESYIIPPGMSSRLGVLRCRRLPVVGVLATEFAGVICGVSGASSLGFAMVAAPNARVWDDSRRRFGASLIFG